MIVSCLVLQRIDEDSDVEATLEQGIDSFFIQIVIEYGDLYVRVKLLDFLLADRDDRFLCRIHNVLFFDEELACQIVEVGGSFGG